MTTTMELHPLCTLFPRIIGSEFEALKADIAANGLRHPIVVHQGFILDGGNRYRACIEAGVEPTTVEFKDGNLVSFVLSANLHRRHLSTGQQAAIVASATDWAKSQKVGRPVNAEALPHLYNDNNSQEEALPLETVADRAAMSGATSRTQRDADKLVREHPELAKEVTQGRKSLYKAVQESKPEPIIESEPESENYGPSAQEIADAEKAEADQLEYIKNLLNTEDDPLAKALADVKKYRAEIEVLKWSRDGHQNKANEMMRMVKSLQAKLKKLERVA